ncbi:RUN domain-containing protein 1-like [Zophobas morio]|uniref:RUN domain-containing protein 1-like n=1 Tax=Zophobas morio TaxID=2755281 RepID=UPI0030837AD3
MLPKGERLEPLGASDDKSDEITPFKSDCTKCVCLEEEKDFLQTSLFALTTHFAQVQFRLQQVVSAPFEEQENLVKSLEEFAFADVHFLNDNDRVDENLMEVVKNRRQQQRILLEKLKSQLKQLREFDMQTRRADMTWTQLLDNLRMKENLEQQLRAQVADLERFIQYLKKLSGKCACKQNKKSCKNYVFEIFDRSFSFLQMLALLHFTWGSNCFTKNTEKTNHWGDLRAKLELAIIDLKRMLRCNEDPKKITATVRKCLATRIRDLIQHGMRSQYMLSFFEYFSEPSSTSHGWDIIMYYYHFKKGVSPKSSKKNLLCVIEEITSTHSRYKRSHDSHFKAFVCAALNAKRLVTWLNLIFHCGNIIETFYYPWSYVATTGYQDSLRSLDVLTPYKFDLPVDLDVRKFQIEDNVFV